MLNLRNGISTHKPLIDMERITLILGPQVIIRVKIRNKYRRVINE